MGTEIGNVLARFKLLDVAAAMHVELREVIDVQRSLFNSNFNSVRINSINSLQCISRKSKLKFPSMSIGIS